MFQLNFHGFSVLQRRALVSVLLCSMMLAGGAAAQVGAPRAPATGDEAKGEVDEDGQKADDAAVEGLLGHDPWLDVSLQAAAMVAGASGGAALAGGVLAFATYASGAYALTSAELLPLLSLALGSVAAVALPCAGVLLGATLTRTHWLRATPAAMLAAFFGVVAMVPGALAGSMIGTAVAGAVAPSSEDAPVGMGAALSPIAVGGAFGAAAAASAGSLLGAMVGFSGGLTLDVFVNDGLEGEE